MSNTTETKTTETPNTSDAKKQAVQKIVTAIDKGDIDTAVTELMTHPVTRERMDYAESRMMYG